METAEKWVRRLGGILALFTLLTIFHGLAHALRRPGGVKMGQGSWTRFGLYYLLVAILYAVACTLLWRPLKARLSSPLRLFTMVLGSAVYFPAMLLVLWGRAALGEMYNVSSALGAQLYAEHKLITRGPYAYVRHPMYLGMLLASLGGLLLYRTWTLVLVAVSTASMLLLRGRREEEALAIQFPGEWDAYRRRVHYLIPRYGK